ncbi:hypothetical protein D3C76_1478150 [compost metagenome]
MAISKRQEGASAVQPSASTVTCMPRRVRISSTWASATLMPITLSSLARRKRMGAALGRWASDLTSMTGPASPPHSPPQMSSSRRVALSITLACSCGSTPRSKRWEESVCRP